MDGKHVWTSDLAAFMLPDFLQVAIWTDIAQRSLPVLEEGTQRVPARQEVILSESVTKRDSLGKSCGSDDYKHRTY